MSTTIVAGEMRVTWSVELPEENKHIGQACTDPAIEAAMCAINDAHIYLWGEDKEPAKVFLEIHEDDIDIEEDNR